MTVHRLRARQEPVDHPWPPQHRLSATGPDTDLLDERDVPFATT